MMDKDTFETKLREAKRQKTQVEQELESVSERWRSERRRLNSEIDRLETALLEAKERRKNPQPSRSTQGIDPGEAAKIQAAADDRVKKAEQNFETERERLRDEISRLQRAVAELIERSNNPMRTTEPIREQFQAQLDAAFNAKQQVEEDFYRARTSWEQEKLKMTGEMFKLRRETPSSKPKEKPGGDDRSQELEKELQETARTRDEFQKQLQDLQSERKSESNKAQTEIDRLQRTLSAADASKTEERKRFETSLKETQRQLEESRGEIERLQKTSQKQIDAAVAGAMDQARQQYEKKLQQMVGDKTQLTEDSKSATLLLEQERLRLETSLKETQRQLDEARTQNEQLRKTPQKQTDTAGADAIQVRQQYEEKLQQLVHDKTQLAEELKSANSLLDQGVADPLRGNPKVTSTPKRWTRKSKECGI